MSIRWGELDARQRTALERSVSIHPDHVPPTSLLRELIGGSGFEYQA